MVIGNIGTGNTFTLATLANDLAANAAPSRPRRREGHPPSCTEGEFKYCNNSCHIANF